MAFGKPPQYKWKRFWCPRDGNLNLADSGFLIDPDGEYGASFNPDVTSFDKIRDTPCLILLGEPGTGKSTALLEHKKTTDASLLTPDISLWVDLRGFQTDVRLIQGIFEHPTFVTWRNGTHRLHLFLDSFDEGLLRVNVLSTILGDEFQKAPVDRLSIRIACRTLDWPVSLERRLLDIWKPEQVRIFEIAPLRRVDVIEAANVEGIDTDKFLEEIKRSESGPLAIKPVTLRFLLSVFKKNGEFPLNQADLYEQGCRLLCAEMNDDRRETKQTGTLSPDQRLAVASRIAVATVFSNRNAVWTHSDLGDVAPEDLKLDELIGETEASKGHTFPVTEAAIRETLGTGLFSSRGVYRSGWAHQTYAEFLAARYLLRHQFTARQIMSLLVHPGDNEHKIVPQLHEVAGWIAGSFPEVFQRVTISDPYVLLRSDAARADEESRAALVAALITSAEKDELFIEPEQRPDLHKLSHSAIEDQLRPFIVDRTKTPRVRDFAIDIARACMTKGLQKDVAQIALDATEPYQLRKAATFFVSQAADPDVRAALKPLTTGSADDIDDDLKGWALRALWPGTLTTEELFDRLSTPKRENYIGGYKGFLRRLEESITPEMLPIALRWAEAHVSRQWDIASLVDKFLILGFDHIDKPDVCTPYVKVALGRFRTMYSLLSDRADKDLSRLIAADQAKRRELISDLLSEAKDPNDSSLVIFRIHEFLENEDFSWLIQQSLTVHSPQFAAAFVQLIRYAFNMRNSSHVDAVILASKQSPAIEKEFTWLLTPVELNSPQATAMKESYERQQRLTHEEEEPEPVSPSPEERFITLLQESESGKPDAFIEMAFVLSVKNGHYGDQFAADMTKFLGWQNADGATRGRIIEAARHFIVEGDPTWAWLGTDRITWASLAGFRALRLLFKVDKEFLMGLAPGIWQRWVPPIIGHPFPTMEDDDNAYEEFIAIIQKHAPDDVVQAVKAVLEKEDGDHKTIFILRHFESHWSHGLTSMLLGKIKSQSLSPGGTTVVLAALLDHEVPEARVLVESWLSLPLPTEPSARERAASAAQLLVGHAKDSGWNVTWPAMQSDTEFGMDMAERTFGGIGYGRIPQLTEEQIADLYIWLMQRFPHNEDPKFEGAHSVGSRESIGQFRDGLINHLAQRGTYAACTAIETIIVAFPDFTWLKWHLQRGREMARRKTWTPPRVEDLIALAQEQERRYVQNGDQLLQIVLESLERLNAKLQGETPAVAFLWNKQADGKLRPKDENELSDFVKLHFEDDLKKTGTIVNREVQIRRGYKPGGKGEITDLHVDAIALDLQGKTLDVVTVIIETKGCWHAQLSTAMETQLKEQYLKDNRCDHAVYLVGWFNCPQWDTSDSRKPPAETLEEAGKRFDEQAAALSTGAARIRAFVLNTAFRS